MRRWFGFIVLLFFCCSLRAQDFSEASLLNPANRDTQKNLNIFTGKPIVYINAGTKAQPDSSLIDTAALLPPPRLSSPPQEITLTTPFKNTITTAFTPQTTDFVFIIQILDNHDMVVEERFQFISTNDAFPFTRVLLSGDKTVELMAATQNGHSFPLYQEKTRDGILFGSQQPFPKGVHTLMLRYRVKDALTQGHATTALDWNLTGTAWPFPINNTAVLVLFPKQTNVFQKEIRFGTNDMRFDDAFTVQTDIEGNQLYLLNQLLPAYANIRLLTTFDRMELPPKTWDDFWREHLELLAGGIIVSCLLGYFILTALSLVYERLPKLSHFKTARFNPFVWTRAMGYRITLKDVYNTLKINHKKILSMIEKNHILRLIAWGSIRLYVFIRLTAEYTIGTLLILLLSAQMTHDQDVFLSSFFWSTLSCFSMVAIYGLYLIRCQSTLKRQAIQMKEILMSEQTILQLTPSEMKKILPIIAAMRLETQWMARYNTYHTTEKDFFNIDETAKNV